MSSGIERNGTVAPSPADQLSVMSGEDQPSPRDPMGKGASCRDKLAAQVPMALSDHGLEGVDLASADAYTHAIASKCRQGPASTTVRKGAEWVLACVGVLTGDVGPIQTNG